MIERAATPDARAALVAYLASKMGVTPLDLVGQMPFEVLAAKRDGKPMGAVLYTNNRNNALEMACAGEPGWLSRPNLRDLFAYPFTQLGVFTVLTQVRRSHREARAFNVKLGFTELCTIPTGIRDNDTVLYGMTRDACRWIETAGSKLRINGAAIHGQKGTEGARPL